MDQDRAEIIKQNQVEIKVPPKSDEVLEAYKQAVLGGEPNAEAVIEFDKTAAGKLFSIFDKRIQIEKKRMITRGGNLDPVKFQGIADTDIFVMERDDLPEIRLATGVQLILIMRANGELEIKSQYEKEEAIVGLGTTIKFDRETMDLPEDSRNLNDVLKTLSRYYLDVERAIDYTQNWYLGKFHSPVAAWAFPYDTFRMNRGFKNTH